MESVLEEIKEEEAAEKKEEKSQNTFKSRLASTSHIWKASAVIIVVAFVFHLISFGSPFWIKVRGATNQTYIGLWSICSSVSDCNFRGDNSDCLLSVRVFHGIAVVCGIILVVLSILYFISDTSRNCRELSTIVIGFISALCIQIGMGIFAKSFGCGAASDLNESTWAWSMAFSITSVVLYCVAVCLLVLDQLRGCSDKGKQQGRKGRNNLGLRIT